MTTATITLSDEARQKIGERLQEVAYRAKNIQLTLSGDADIWSAYHTAEGIEAICFLLGKDLGMEIIAEESDDDTEEEEDEDEDD